MFESNSLILNFIIIYINLLINLILYAISYSYEPVWKIIDERWENQLHHPLHASGYFLNPVYQYSPDFEAESRVKNGLYDCMERMIEDRDVRSTIHAQLESFKKAKGLFGRDAAKLTLGKKSPAEWWDSFGDDCPELQKWAIRILSLTCSSSGCERNWSAFEMVIIINHQNSIMVSIMSLIYDI